MTLCGKTIMKIAITIFLSFFLASHALAVDSTYNTAVAGKKCSEGQNQSLSCSYRVGKGLFVEIAGIGSPDTGIAFLKSDYDSDYYGKYGSLHGCVIVNSTKNIFSFAFISPKNGKVYRTWQECKDGL